MTQKGEFLMLNHIVMFRFKEGTTSEQVAEITEGLSTLPGEIDALVDYRFGPNAGITESSWDYGVCATFISDADYRIYAEHPAHTAVIRTTIMPAVDEIVRVQFRS
jgi:hypothetical protein